MAKSSISAMRRAAVMLMMVMSGCGNHPTVVETQMHTTGIAFLKIAIAPDSPFLRIARKFSVTISAPDMLTMTDTTLSISDGSLSSEIKGIPAGSYRLFEVDVRDSLDTLRYRGFAHADVIADSTVHLSVPVIRIITLANTKDKIIRNAEPMAWWSFDSMSGDMYYDITGHGYDAVSSGLGLVPGVKGMALACPGRDYELIVKNSLDKFYVTTFTIETWFFSNIDPDLNDVFEKIFDYQFITQNQRNGYSVHVTQEGQVAFSLSSDSGDYWLPCVSKTTIQAKTWYHIACSYDSLFLKVYINGALEQSTYYSGTYVKPQIDVRIGCQTVMVQNDTAVRYRINGLLDEMKFYNFALPEDSIRSHYYAYKPKETTRNKKGIASYGE
jgi:hypothetical protein